MKRMKITSANGNKPRGRAPSFKIGVPIEIGQRLFDLDLTYEAELTEGLLFRPVVERPAPSVEFPEWARVKERVEPRNTTHAVETYQPREFPGRTERRIRDAVSREAVADESRPLHRGSRQ